MNFFFLLTAFFCTLTLFASEVTKEEGYNDWLMETNGETFFLQKLFKNTKDIIVFDVGANKGQWSLYLLDICPTSNIFAFEPNSSTYNFFVNLKNTSTDNHSLYISNIALSDGKETKATLYCYDAYGLNGSELNSLYNRKIFQYELPMHAKPTPITLSSVDIFCTKHNIDHIDYLKIDTEGNEYKVILGAKNMLDERKIQIVQFEYGGTYPDSNSTLEEVYHFLSQRGYSIFRISPSKLIPIQEWDATLENYNYCNYIAISPYYLENLDEDLSSWILFN